MKKFLAALLIGLSLVSITLDASAARLGGGASFGRSMSVPKAAPSSPFKAPSAAATKRPGNCRSRRCSREGSDEYGQAPFNRCSCGLGLYGLGEYARSRRRICPDAYDSDAYPAGRSGISLLRSS